MASTPTAYRFGRFEVRPSQRCVLADGAPAHLGARAFDMLLALIERRDRVVSGAELFELIWPGLVVEENNLRQQVAALRKLLGPQAVLTVAGRGYRFGLALDEQPRPDRGAVARPLPNNLPQPASALVGREREIAEIAQLLAGTRLLTLTGAGGVGKTRLALEVAARSGDGCKDGVWLVELAPLADPALVPRSVADVLGVHEEPGRPLHDTLLDYLRRRELLIVLDNCEHLIEACARLAGELLQWCPGVRTLATSREALAIDGESAWRVPSLATAEPSARESALQLIGYAAIELFVQRAAAVQPGFRLTDQNALAVARICHQLDGIPLALELAAARVRALRVEQVAERLDDRFHLLTRGSRTALQRHQTLASLIDWSHDLLSEPERVLFRRLAVFAGGWTLEAAEAVCGTGGLAAGDVLELLANLVEKSLVVPDEQSAEPRYRMLETIRQYGIVKLDAAGEAERIRSRHLGYMGDFAARIRTRLNDADQLTWHAKVEADLDNVRAALKWSLAPARADAGLLLIHSLHRFWYKGMHWKETVGWIEQIAAARGADAAPNAIRARSLYCASMLAYNFDLPAARRLSEECLEMSRAIGFGEGMAWALLWLGYIDTRKRDESTRELFEESLRLGRQVEDRWYASMVVVQCLICYAGYEALMGRAETAESLAHDCEREVSGIGGDRLYVGHCRALLGNMAVRRGDFERAGELLNQALAIYREVESKFDIGGALAQLGFLALRQGHSDQALQLFRQSLALHRNYPMSQWVAKGLAHLVIALAACRRSRVAAQLAGLLSGSGGDAGTPPELAGQVAREYGAAVVSVRDALGEPAFAEAWNAGCSMSREQGIELALAD